jgi:ATP-dependent helicase HrpB
VTDHDSHPREAKVRMAFALSEDELREIFADDIVWHHVCAYAPRHRKLETFEEERLGALILTRRPWHTAPAEAKARAMLEAIEDLGLPWSRSSTLLAARMRLLPDAPNMDEAHLRATAQDWLLPYLTDITTQAQLSKLDLRPALLARLDWTTQNRLAREVPEHYTTPLGRKIAIDYSGDHPEVALRLQEVFGETRHPTVGGRPLRKVLLSPAQRPVQTTLDLPQFWQSSYADVRKDMRGRYPKHPWPEDPTQADPTVRVKRRT